MLYNSHFTHKYWHHSLSCVMWKGEGTRASTCCLGIHFTLLWTLPRKVLTWERIFITSREGKSSCSAHHPSSAHTSLIPHPLQVQSEARSDFALWRHGIGMAQRDTAPEVTELRHCLLKHLIGKSIHSCSVPRVRRQSITCEAASY